MSDTNPSQRELDVLKVLWELGEAKVRDVHEAMCQDEKCAFTTVQTLLRIMADKGWSSRAVPAGRCSIRPSIPASSSARISCTACSTGRSTSWCSTCSPPRSFRRRDARAGKTDRQSPPRKTSGELTNDRFHKRSWCCGPNLRSPLAALLLAARAATCTGCGSRSNAFA